MDYGDYSLSGVRWYRSLVPKEGTGKHSLLNDFTEGDIFKGLLVCGITSDNRHIFALFPDYLSFVKFNEVLPDEKRCFFELIFGDRPQKPHFDLEIEIEKIEIKTQEVLIEMGNKLLDTFLNIMIPLFEETYHQTLNLETDVLIFQSHGNKKRSYHVIVDNYSHCNNLEAKAFYQLVIQKIPDQFKPFIDSSVYSKKQQFRMIGSQKKGSGRIKSHIPSWKYQDREITYCMREKPHNIRHYYVLMFEASLISYTNNCKPLLDLIPKQEKNKKDGFSYQEDQGDLSKETVKEIFELLKLMAGVKNGDLSNFPYRIKEVIGSLILLTRLCPSRCRICNRIHEHENPFIVVYNDKEGFRKARFYCRRSNKGLSLGYLKQGKGEEEEKRKEKRKDKKIITSKYLPSGVPILDPEDILTRMAQTSKVSMKTIRYIRKNK